MLRQLIRFLFPLMGLLLATGCATGPNANLQDPLEPWNRGVYKFNNAVDRAVLKPAATGYQKLVPSPVRTGIGNFFSNLADVWSMVNHALQGEMGYAGKTALRVSLNTVLGIGGLFDVATPAELTAPRADLGQTLGKWGVPTGPYLVLPVLGPSTLRDGVGTITATYYDPVNRVSDNATRNVLIGTRLINIRSQLLNTTETVDDIALDEYTFFRDVYLKRRQNMIAPFATKEDDVDYSVEDEKKPASEQVLPKLPAIPLPTDILK